MDYKERYEKALEKAREYNNVYKDHTMMSYAKGALEEIFPELKESEKEKIRKSLIALVTWSTSYSASGISNVDAKKMLAWLEKQKHDLEDKEETVVYQGEVYTRVYRDELDKFACKYPKTVPLPSKKYRKYSETDLIIAVKEGAKWKMKQEPVWTEEDEKFLTSILRDVKHGEPLDKLQYDWLKSIRLQNTWKPSEAQMDSITCAVRKMKESACYDSELVSLLNDLKKLSEK